MSLWKNYFQEKARCDNDDNNSRTPNLKCQVEYSLIRSDIIDKRK